VPFVARWPGVIKPDSRSEQTICLTDLMATAATIVGARLPDDAAEDSVDLLPVLKGAAGAGGAVREATVHHSIDGAFAIRRGDWKLILAKGSGGWSLPEARAAGPAVQLYNLKDDPAESNNVAAQQTEVVAGLRDLLERYRREGRSVPRR
jgi:arylsulfatase A-like enzyme